MQDSQSPAGTTTQPSDPASPGGAGHKLARPLRVGVIGTGRMGRLHTRVLSQMAAASPPSGASASTRPAASPAAPAPAGGAAAGGATAGAKAPVPADPSRETGGGPPAPGPSVQLVGVFDADTDQAAAVAHEFGTTVASGLDDLLSRADAVVLAVPTRFHLETARQCLTRGVHVLIEKPLAATVQECREIVALAREKSLTVQVGHVERFNPAVRAMARLDVQPRFIEVTRVSPLTFRSIDVGVVLDMMIHDIDIVLLLAAGRPVRSVEAVGVSVIGEVEDVCNARVTFGDGAATCVANLTASRLALKTERKLRVFSPDAYVSLDYAKKYGIVARRGENLSAIRDAVARIRSGEIEDLSDLNYTDLVQVEELAIDDVEPLRAELEAFAHAVRTGTRPVVSAEDGLAAVELATRIVAAVGGATL